MIFVAATLLGIVSWKHLKMEIFPNAELPMLFIQVSSQIDLTPEYMEQEAIVPVESMVAGLENIESIESPAGRRQGSVMITYEERTDLKYAYLKLDEQIAALRGSLPDEFSGIDVLVNNDGLALGLDAADAANLDDWDTMIDRNIKGLTYCTRAMLPGMVARGRGHVINIGSVAASYPYPGGNAYGATKAFVRQFSLNLRSDLLGKNVRVTCVEPGLAETEFSLVRFKGDESKAGTPYTGIENLRPESKAAVQEFLYMMQTPRM